MADAVSLEGLEFEISAVTSDAIKNLDNLSGSLKNLKSAVDTNISGAIGKFQELNKAISAVSENNPIHKLAESLEKISSVSKLSNIKIPELKISDNFSEKITNISSAVNQLDTEKLGLFAEKIQVFGGLGNVGDSVNSLSQAITNFPADTLNEKVTKIQVVFGKPFGTAFIDRLSELKTTTADFPVATLSSIAYALGQIRDNYTISIPQSFLKELELLSNTAEKIPGIAVVNLEALSNALSTWKDTKGIGFPKGFNTALINFNDAIKKIGTSNLPALESLGKALQGLSGLKDIKLSSSIANQISKISDALKKLTEDDINKLRELADAVKKIGEVGDKSLKLKVNTSDVSEAKNNFDTLKQSIIGTSPIAKIATFTFKNMFLAPLKYAGKLSVAIGKSILSPIQKVASRLKVVIAGFGKIIKLRAFRFIITSITSGIKEGTDNLYQFSKGINGEFAKSMDMLATSMLYFKNSVGAAIAPIINQLAPAVDLLIDKVVEGTNKINQFLAQMTGATYWTKAVKYPKEYAEAVDDAKKSVQDFTMGFDELNIISDNSSSKKSDNLDYSKMFEIVDLEKDPWTEQLKNSIESGDWYGAGNLLGEKFNSIFQNIDYSGIGSELGTKINNAISLAKGFLDVSDFEIIGTGVASFLNSGFEKIDFYNLGSVLAGKWNILIDTVHGFVTEFKFAEFGKELSDAVNGWFDTIDLNKAVDDVSRGLQGILSTMSSFLTNTKFKNFGTKVGKALNKFIDDLPAIIGEFASTASSFTTGVFDFLSSTLEGIDWKDSGEKLFDAIEELFTNVEWDKVAESFSEFIGSAIGAAFGLLIGFVSEAQEAYSKIFDWLSSGEVDVGKEALDWSNDHVVKPLLKGIVTNLEGEETWNDVNAVIEEKGSMWDFWQGYGEYIYDQWHKAGEGAEEYNDSLFKIEEYHPIITEGWTKFWEGVGGEAFDVLTKVGNTLKKWYNKWVSFWEKLGGKAHDKLVELVEKIKQGAEDIIEGFKSGLVWTGLISFLKQKLVDPFVNGFKSLFGIHSPSTVMKKQGTFIIEGLKDGIKNALKGIKNWISDNIFQPFLDKFDSFKRDWKSGWESAEKTFSNFKSNWSTGAEEIKNSLSEKLGDIKSNISGKLDSAFDTAKNNFDTFKSNWIDGAETIKTSLSEKWNSIKEKVTDTLNPLFDTSNENFNSFKENWITGFTDIKDKVTEKATSIKESLDNLLNDPFGSLKYGANNILWLFENMVNGVIDAMNNMAFTMNSMSFSIPDWVPGIGGGTLGFNLPYISRIQLFRFDKGGFPNSGDLFFANENGKPEFVGSMGGRTAVANNDQIVEGIYEAVYSAMMAVMSNQNNEGNTEINLYLDSKQIAAKVEERKLTRGQQIFAGGVVNEY